MRGIGRTTLVTVVLAGAAVTAGAFLLLKGTVRTAGTSRGPHVLAYASSGPDCADPGIPPGAPDDVQSVAFALDGGTLAGCTASGQLILWDLRSGAVLPRAFRQHCDVGWLAAVPGPTAFVSATDGGAVRGWGRQGELLSTTRLGGKFLGVAFSPDGAALATSDESTLRVWNLRTKRARWRVPLRGGPANALAISGAGDACAVAPPAGPVEVRNAKDGRLMERLPNCDAASSLALSANGSRLAIACGWHGTDGLRFWDVTHRRYERWASRGPLGREISLAFSLDGRFLASTGEGELALLDVRTAGQVRSAMLTQTHGYPPGVSLAVSPDGRTLAIGGKFDPQRPGPPEYVELWDVQTWRRLRGLTIPHQGQ